MDMEKMFKEIVGATVTALAKKIKDINKIHLSSGELLEKCATLDRIHKNIFEGAFGSKYTPDEVADRSLTYYLRSLDFVSSMVGSSMIRIYNSGDLCIVAPWAVLTTSLSENPDEFCAGKLVLPITKGPVATVCFLPCGGLDFATDQVS